MLLQEEFNAQFVIVASKTAGLGQLYHKLTLELTSG